VRAQRVPHVWRSRVSGAWVRCVGRQPAARTPPGWRERGPRSNALDHPSTLSATGTPETHTRARAAPCPLTHTRGRRRPGCCACARAATCVCVWLCVCVGGGGGVLCRVVRVLVSCCVVLAVCARVHVCAWHALPRGTA
jgi:hypothetical protein